ncbi:MAG: hypothetical protein EXX96DRAFT_465051, partial [Benjaminiella poitrasii]
IISDLTIESTNWLLSTCMARIKGYLYNNATAEIDKEQSIIMRRRNLSFSSLSLSKLPYKATIKSRYSISVPGTPDPELYYYQL